MDHLTSKVCITSCLQTQYQLFTAISTHFQQKLDTRSDTYIIYRITEQFSYN